MLCVVVVLAPLSDDHTTPELTAVVSDAATAVRAFQHL